MSRFRSAATAVVALFLLASPNPSAADEQGPRSVVAPLVDETPVADGRLDEDVWRLAATTGAFIQQEPRFGEPATFPTEVLIAITEDALLIGARLSDPDPDQVVAREYRRDSELESDDNFLVALDTYHDHRNAFFFATNAVGTRLDGLVQNEGAAVNNEWDGVWAAGSRRTPSGWVTEMVIPFETLRFPAGATAFGVNFGRSVARTREESWWAEISNDWGFNARWRVSAYGVVEGLAPARPGGRIKLKPFGSASSTVVEEERETDGDLGLDAKVALGPNLNLDLTVNTDFAQVEADEQQVNLTRFELFFPEQRDFFLENAGLFQVGETTLPFEPPQTLLFFSRRIGLSDDGDIVPILGGARITGKMGSTDVGAFHIRQQEAAGVAPATAFSAVRLRRDVLARSSVGALALDRSEAGGGSHRVVAAGVGAPDSSPAGALANGVGRGSHRVVAADFSWAPSDLTRLSGWAARSSGADEAGLEPSGSQTAAGLHGEAANDLWSLFGDFVHIGEDFDSPMGFVPRRGVRKLRSQALWKPRPGRFGIRQIFAGPGIEWITEADGALQSGRYEFGPYFLFEDGSSFFFNVSRQIEGLDEAFELRDGVEIAAGEYRTTNLMTMLETSRSRRVSLNLFAMETGFFDGELRVLSPGVAVRPHPRLRFQINYSRNRVRLPQEGGDFETNLIVLRGLAALSPDAFVRALLQWNDDEGDFSGNVQLRWTWRPGSDLYVVYNDHRPWSASPADIRHDRELIVKATWYWVPG